MQAEDLLFNEGCEREVIEQISEIFPDISVSINSEALVIETVHLCNLSTLVVSSGQGDAVLVTDFVAHQQRNRLDGVVTSVNVVTHEQVICLRGLTSDSKQFQQVVELTMHITTNGHRTFDRLYILFFTENGLCLIA